MKEYIDLFDCSEKVTKALSSGGVLISTAKDGRMNTMTMGWAFCGQLWEKPYVIAMIREPRYTKQLLDETGEFTISVPDEGTDRKILAYCGSRSGRDTDKIKDLGLTLTESGMNHVPGLKELPLTLECKVTYKQTMDISALPEELRTGLYSDGQLHTMYFGEVLKAYIIK